MSDDHGLEHADEQGRYLLGTRIATGGMGEVWRATDTLLGRPVAIKLLKAEYSDHPDFRARFETEARHAAALSHPGVAAVFDVGEAPDGRPFLVMELVAGEPLDALLEPGREMPPESARALLHQAAVAVAAAHAAGIVHRDLKPGNLLVTAEAQVKITDFGIARATDSVPLTQTGQIIGTPQYISPEQAEGGTATPASDVYALGVLLFECLAGHRPFTAETPVALALAHLRDPVPPLPDDVPADLVAIVEKALAKDPADRFPDAAAFAEALVDPSVVLPEEPTRTSLLAALPALAGLAGRGPRTGPRTGPGTGPRSGPRTGPRTGPGTGSRTGPRTGPQSGTATAARTGAGTRLRSWPRRTDTAQTPRHRPVSPWLAVLPAALVAGLVAWIVIGSTESPSAGTASVAGSSAKPVASKVIDIRPEDYLDRPADEAQAELEELGLVVERLPTANPDGSEEPGTVATITPVGRLERGDAITLNVWRSPPSVAPASSTSSTSTGGEPDGKDDRDGPGGEASASGKGDSKDPDGGPRGKGKKKR